MKPYNHTDQFHDVPAQCPFCHRSRSVKASAFVPIVKADCTKCGAVVEVSPIGKAKKDFAMWRVEWTA